MASSPIVYLVTGANRGIGFALVTALAKRPDVKIYAGARDPAGATTLAELAAKSKGQVQIVKLSSTSVDDAQSVAETIKVKEGKLDVVIANAGIAKYYGPLAETPLQELDDHFEVNTKGTLILYQATHALLAQSPSPKFILISSGAGSLGASLPLPIGAYGSSKAAANFLMVRMHDEQPKWVVLPVHPGFVQTDMGNAGAQAFGLERASITVEDSVNGMLKVIDEAKRQEKAQFIDYTGKEVAW